MDFPPLSPVLSGQLDTISTFSLNAGIGRVQLSPSLSGLSSSSWPANNRTIFVPFIIVRPFVVVSGWWENGTSASGNRNCGIYTYEETPVLLASTGAVAQAGTNAIQKASLSITLQPGAYYMALSHSNTIGTNMTKSYTLGAVVSGVAYQDSNMPATATLVRSTAYIPVFGITSRSEL